MLEFLFQSKISDPRQRRVAHRFRHVSHVRGQLHQDASRGAHRGRSVVAHGQVPARLGIQLHRDPLLDRHLRGESRRGKTPVFFIYREMHADAIFLIAYQSI